MIGVIYRKNTFAWYQNDAGKKARVTAKWQEINARMAADDAVRKATDGMYDTSPQAALARLSSYAAENGAELDLDKIPSLSCGSFTQIGRAA